MFSAKNFVLVFLLVAVVMATEPSAQVIRRLCGKKLFKKVVEVCGVRLCTSTDEHIAVKACTYGFSDDGLRTKCCP
ncbi:unnamed protein product [Caenorhabditis sp. 36 PRJEB53466]|nr:unnamed protein product [Caenorhabditis sp. 36 PRJEB53466]